MEAIRKDTGMRGFHANPSQWLVVITEIELLIEKTEEWNSD